MRGACSTAVESKHYITDKLEISEGTRLLWSLPRFSNKISILKIGADHDRKAANRILCAVFGAGIRKNERSGMIK